MESKMNETDSSHCIKMLHVISGRPSVLISRKAMNYTVKMNYTVSEVHPRTGHEGSEGK
jgi:hypothetical protein